MPIFPSREREVADEKRGFAMLKNLARAMGSVLAATGLVVILAAAAQAVPAMNTLESKPTGAGTIYLGTGTNLTIQGINSDDGDTITVWVNSVQVATIPALVCSNGTSFTCDFNATAIGVVQTLQVRADHLGLITSSSNQDYLVDTTAPDAPTLHWSSPIDGAFVSTGLGNISATATDSGGSGVDFASCTITVSSLNGTLGTTSNQIYFTPNSGWGAFQTNTSYTVSVTVRDLAGNVSTASSSFLYDSTSPDLPTLHWSSPVDAAFVSTGLGNISATATDSGGSGVDFASCTITVSVLAGTRGNTANQIYFTPTGGWGVFQTNTNYTVSATIRDRAGNVSTASSSFLYDSTLPDFPTLFWSSPANSVYMSSLLGSISATATDSGGSGVDFASCSFIVSSMPGTLGNTANQIYFTPTSGWGAFQTGTYYAVTVIVRDFAGNVNRTVKSFQYDKTPPSIPVINWTNPLNNPMWMGTRLNAIYATYTDTGGAGIDTAATTITVWGIPGTKSATATQINFTPSPPGVYTSRFVTGGYYSITITAVDRAGNTRSSYAAFNFDGNSPNASAIRWTDPTDLIYAGPKLNQIWATNITDSESGINWSTAMTSLQLSPAIPYTNTNAGSVIYFNPTNGFPATGGNNFVNNTLYTVTATVYDYAANYIVTTKQFRCDTQAPTATLYWNNPNRGNPPSYYMGQGLNRIWAVLNGTVTTTSGYDPINYDDSNTGTAISITPAPSAGARAVSANTVEWSISPVSNFNTSFANGTFYAVTVTLADMAGNTGIAAAWFKKDEDKPVINDVRISSPNVVVSNNDVILRGTSFPLSPRTYTSSITDNPLDWGGRTSLNGNGISYNYLAAALPSDMRIYHEVSGLVNTSTGFSGAGTAYQGFLTLPGTYTPLEGVYSISTTARDWAHYASLTYTSHEVVQVSRVLVDNTSPTETAVAPPSGAFYVTGGRTYMRSVDLNAYPGNVTVGARDLPADRGYNFWRRLNFDLSPVTLLNPDGITRTLTFLGNTTNGWAQPGPVITDLCNSFTATINLYGFDAPIYPRPEYIGNTVEGRYTLNLHFEDRITASLGSPNVRDVSYYFFNDVTPPRLLSWSPFSINPLPDSYTSSFSDVKATIYDPNLRDGFPGAGLNMPACNALVYMALTDSSHPTGVWTTQGSGTISSSGPFVGPQGQSLNNQTVYALKVGYVINPGRKIYLEAGKHSALVDNFGSVSFTGLDPSSEYMVGWQIPSTYAYDGISVIGAMTNTAILKNGLYFGNFIVADMVGNTAQVESTNFNYLSAGGAIYLSVAPAALLADGLSTATVTTTAVHLSDNPSAVVQDGTELTVSSTLGDIITPDVDTILPGVQLATVGGIVSFTIRSRPGQVGQSVLRVKSVSGFADSGDVTGMLQMVLAKMENGAVAIDPATEKIAARYTLTGNVNPILSLTAGLDNFTVDFPEGTLLPASVPSGSILLNQTPVTNATISGQRLTVVTPLMLAPNTFFTLVLPPEAGIINPRAGHYQLNLQTTQDISAITLPYNIIIHIDDQDVVPAPNPCKTGRMRFFFNLSGPARVELLILNLLGDKVSRVEQDFPGAKQGEVLDWNCQRVGPGVYWAKMKLDYADGSSVKLKKKKVVIIQ
jgi:hypothetical protein